MNQKPVFFVPLIYHDSNNFYDFRTEKYISLAEALQIVQNTAEQRGLIAAKNNFSVGKQIFFWLAEDVLRSELQLVINNGDGTTTVAKGQYTILTTQYEKLI